MPITAETFQFLADLERNNSKDWFEANRDRYEAHWKSAAFDLIDLVTPFFESLSPTLKSEARVNGSLRRINRDVRFSKDKSPYNARLHLIFWSGAHPNRSPAIHFVLQPDGIGYGAGAFGLDPATLKACREKIISTDDGAGLVAALEEAKAVGCTMGKPDLARLPKGFDADGHLGDLLRFKSFVARTHDALAPKERLIDKHAVDWIKSTTTACMPLIRWLCDVRA